jgi:23S rRNA (cytosine1962-C5)-methyltransferase
VIRADAPPPSGGTVDLVSSGGIWLGRGAWSPQSRIAARAWSFDHEEPIGPAFFRHRLQRALAARRLPDGQLPIACRLVNAESDGLPGTIVDRYAGWLVCQFLSTGAEFWRETIAGELQSLVPCEGLYERSDVDVREREGLPPRAGLLAGAEPPELIEIREEALRFLVDVRRGHKTGFYLDQRENRARLAPFVRGGEVLNAFSYTGAFAVAALAGGAARVTNVEGSADALALAARHVELNGLDPSRCENVEGDVFIFLRRYRDSRRSFDLVVLDPPKFAESRANVPGASRGYKDVNLLAIKLLRPGGILFTFSCSGAMDAALFQKIVSDAALDAGRDVQILHWLSQASDHPVALNFPEGRYLKGLICRVL